MTPGSWTDVANNALHYTAGGLLLVGAGWAAKHGLMSGGDLTTLVLCAAAALGWKLSR